jgi:hypothetical protein
MATGRSGRPGAASLPLLYLRDIQDIYDVHVINYPYETMPLRSWPAKTAMYKSSP